MSLTRRIIYAQFSDLDLENDAVISISDANNNVSINFCSFTSITTNLENACIYVISSSFACRALCFNHIRAKHTHSEVVGGSCLSLFNAASFSLSEQSLIDTNTDEYFIHSSIYICNSAGDVSKVNQSNTQCVSKKQCCRGFCFKQQTNCIVSNCVFDKCEGGSCFLFESTLGNIYCEKILFNNIISNEGYLIDEYFQNAKYSFSYCFCIDCDVNYISRNKTPMIGWYVDQIPPDYLTQTVTSTENIISHFEIFCKYNRAASESIRNSSSPSLFISIVLGLINYFNFYFYYASFDIENGWTFSDFGIENGRLPIFYEDGQ